MARRRNRERPKANRGDRFNLMPEWVLLHPDWKTAPTGALPVLIDIHKRWSGPIHNGGLINNNGRIGYGVRTAAGGLPAEHDIKKALPGVAIGKDTAGKLLDWLMQRDWIRPGENNWHMFSADGKRRQREWEVTYLPTPGRPSSRRESGKVLEPGQVVEECRRISIEHRLLNSAAYVTVSPAAKTVLIELLRLFNGGNNADIRFGGSDGRRIGLKPRTTWRALGDLSERTLIRETGAADPFRKIRRRWLLTMCPAPGARKAANEYLRWRPENQIACPKNDTREAATVPEMTLAAAPLLPPKAGPRRKKSSASAANIDVPPSVILGTVSHPHSVKNRTHIESHSQPAAAGLPAHAVPPAAAPSATARAAGPLASLARNQPNAKGAQKIGAPPNRQIDPIEHPLVVIDEPIGENLFGNAPEALPMMPSRRVELRARLKTVVRRRRGLQSRVAEALNLSRHTVANILAGREDFTPIADSLVRRWLDGDPVGPGWPELPANEDENDDAAAA